MDGAKWIMMESIPSNPSIFIPPNLGYIQRNELISYVPFRQINKSTQTMK